MADTNKMLEDETGGWVVVQQNKSNKIVGKQTNGSKEAKVVARRYSCNKCPAQFFKSLTLKNHLSLHGANETHKCRSCDYSVKTYGNLIKHEAIHQLPPRSKPKVTKSKQRNSTTDIPSSGMGLFLHKTDQQLKNEGSPTKCQTAPSSSADRPLHVDPEFGIPIHGSSKLIYPYICHKCPSAFEKREQYKVHLSLHELKQKRECEKCVDGAPSRMGNATDTISNKRRKINSMTAEDKISGLDIVVDREESHNKNDINNRVGIIKDTTRVYSINGNCFNDKLNDTSNAAFTTDYVASPLKDDVDDKQLVNEGTLNIHIDAEITSNLDEIGNEDTNSSSSTTSSNSNSSSSSSSSSTSASLSSSSSCSCSGSSSSSLTSASLSSSSSSSSCSCFGSSSSSSSTSASLSSSPCSCFGSSSSSSTSASLSLSSSCSCSGSSSSSSTSASLSSSSCSGSSSSTSSNSCKPES